MLPGEMTARVARGDLYGGHELVASGADGVLILLGGRPSVVVLGGGDLDARAAPALVGRPLTLVCYRGPLVSVEAVRVEGLLRGAAIHVECRPTTFGPPLDVLDAAELEPEP